jgi:hypothetical protein
VRSITHARRHQKLAGDGRAGSGGLCAVDADGGAPLPGATVQGSTGSGATHRLVQTVADLQGQYRLDGLVPGRHSLSVRADGYATESLAVTIEQNQQAPGWDVALARVEPVWIALLDEQGDAAAGRISYTVAAGGTGLCGTASALEDDTFLVRRSCGPGDYVLTITADGYRTFQGTLKVPKHGYPRDAPFAALMLKLK